MLRHIIACLLICVLLAPGVLGNDGLLQEIIYRRELAEKYARKNKQKRSRKLSLPATAAVSRVSDGDRSSERKAIIRELRVKDEIGKCCTRLGFPYALALAVAKVESDFNPYAVSSKGARGVMQLMPATMQDYGVTDAFNVKANVEAGVGYLQMLIDKFGVTGGLAAYNWGPGNYTSGGDWPKETQRYVRRVQKYYRVYSAQNIKYVHLIRNGGSDE